MGSNYWQAQNNQNGSEGVQRQPRKSGLLSKYSANLPSREHGQASRGPSSLSPFPDTSNQDKPFAPSRSQFAPQPLGNGPDFLGRRGQMAALPQPNRAPVDPQPFASYSPPRLPSTRQHPAQPIVWRRSRVQRVTHLRKKRLERWQHTGPGSRRLSSLIFSIIAAIALVLLSSTASYAYNFYQSEVPQVQNLANLQNIPQSTHIYDRHGVLLSTLYQNTKPGDGGRGTLVSYQYLPGVLQDAQIAAEDPTFWINNGIDPQGMLRALTQYVSNGGRITSGGSTITQQLIKNLSNNRQDTFQRKANEAALAIGLTQQYPKWKILEMYFNVTPYGAQDQGVEAAIEDYFGLQPQCDANTHKCIPAVAFLDRDLSRCKNPAVYTTCASDPILALARAALLAGIPQNPTHNDPTVNDQTYQHMLAVRLPYVLRQMQADNMSINLGLGDPVTHKIDKGPITADVIAQVEKVAAGIKIVGFRQTMLAPHFVQWVTRTLANALGNYQELDLNGVSIPGYRVLITSGLNIYTTLDLNLEHFIEVDIKHNLRDRVLEKYTGYGPLNTVYNVNDSAVVVMDAHSGEILAMDGSADYNDNSPPVSGQVNAALALRQPGSTMKPIVYAAAFEKGWYPGMRLIDEKTYFPNGGNPQADAQSSTYQPFDYGQKYNNVDETVRVNLANSFNIPAIKALMFAGFDDVVTMARRMGVTDIDTDLAIYNNWAGAHGYIPNTLDERFGPGLAIGSAEISDLQMTGVYQVFANNGVRVPYRNILNIYDNYGHNLYHYDPTHPNGARVLSPQIAYLVNDMLDDDLSRDKYEFAGVHTLTMSDWNNQPVAAKTGTTDGPLDNWTIGYTTSLVVGVWSGNANGDNPMKKNIIGVSGAGPIWHDVIEYASGRSLLGMTPDIAYPTAPFPQPDGLVQAQVNSINGLQGSGTTDWMLVNEQPQQSGLPTCDPTNLDPNNPACLAPGDGSLGGGGSIFGNSNPFG